MLSPDAEIFLARLADELRPLGHEEREAVLLELRGHFEERQRQGRQHLLSAIDHMGSPATLAHEFIEASAAAMRGPPVPAPGVYLPAVIANSNLPTAYHRGVPRLRIGEMIGDIRATYEAIGDRWWSVCVVLVAGFTVCSYISALGNFIPDQDALPDWLILLVRLALSLAGWAAAYRCIFGKDDEVWQLDKPAIRFGAVASALFAIQVVVPMVAMNIATALGVIGVDPLLPFYLQPAVLLLNIAVGVATLRFQPWAVSLALGKGISLRESWQGTAGKTGALIAGWFIIVAPFYVVHLLLAIAAVHVPTQEMVRYGMLISIADALAAMCSVLATALLNAMVYRWVVREPIPPARPFSSTRPTDAQIAETNMRFRRFVAEKARRDLENSVAVNH